MWWSIVLRVNTNKTKVFSTLIKEVGKIPIVPI